MSIQDIVTTDLLTLILSFCKGLTKILFAFTFSDVIDRDIIQQYVLSKDMEEEEAAEGEADGAVGQLVADLHRLQHVAGLETGGCAGGA